MHDTSRLKDPTPDRRRLYLRLSRRQLLALLREQFDAADERSCGKAVYRLVDLGRLDDAALAGLIPQVLPETHIQVLDGWVWAQPPDDAEARRLFQICTPALQAFNLLNGRRTLDEAGRLLTAELGCSETEGWRTVKALFLSLVEQRVCVPV